MREIILDTETTGLDQLRGDRLVEIGCVEIFNRMPTGQTFHRHINPERDMPAEAFNVHSLSSEFLADKPSPRARIWIEGRAGWGMGGETAGAHLRKRWVHAGARGSRRRATRPAARRTHGGGALLAPGHRHCRGSGQAPRAGPGAQGHQAGQYPGELRDWSGEVYGVWHRLAPPARASGP